ncbi:CLUMA_CG001298, isoform A [Clunio marinus]|uniref:CLUMA_CG001298, isoform A n=1 Tax=Clunio marinus TaxID=568069 RepID=A0A1J1HMN1_9DIPT|nr:CLUMA_CG001298, isoform A [Clunio marinus]
MKRFSNHPHGQTDLGKQQVHANSHMLLPILMLCKCSVLNGIDVFPKQLQQISYRSLQHNIHDQSISLKKSLQEMREESLSINWRIPVHNPLMFDTMNISALKLQSLNIFKRK